MTRIELMMALHYSCSPMPYPERDSPHVRKTHERWLAKGFIVPASAHDRSVYGTEYTGTDALRVWTEALMEIPEPVQVMRWEIPR